MNAVEAALRTVAADLEIRRARWALIGGFAVSIRSEPRFTRDVDVAVAVSGDPDAEALVVRSLMAAGCRVLASVEQAVRLIAQRGYHRGRDLPAALSALLAGS